MWLHESATKGMYTQGVTYTLCIPVPFKAQQWQHCHGNCLTMQTHVWDRVTEYCYLFTNMHIRDTLPCIAYSTWNLVWWLALAIRNLIQMAHFWECVCVAVHYRNWIFSSHIHIHVSLRSEALYQWKKLNILQSRISLCSKRCIFQLTVKGGLTGSWMGQLVYTECLSKTLAQQKVKDREYYDVIKIRDGDFYTRLTYTCLIIGNSNKFLHGFRQLVCD